MTGPFTPQAAAIAKASPQTFDDGSFAVYMKRVPWQTDVNSKSMKKMLSKTLSAKKTMNLALREIQKKSSHRTQRKKT